MKNSKKFICFSIFNVMCTFVIMPMEHQLVRVNGTVSCSNGSMVNNVSLCTQGNIPYHVNSLARTHTKKTVMSPSQERNNILLNDIRDKIDRDHLQINTDDLFRPLVGTFWSFYKIGRLYHPQIIDELTKIQSYISVQDKEYIFQKLEENHYYVNMLLQLAVDVKVKEIRHVTGKTIDILFYSPKKNDFTRLVHARALEQHSQSLEGQFLNEAWFVKAALDNSYTIEELYALLSSKTFAAIKGYPKENFEKYITSKINKKDLSQ